MSTIKIIIIHANYTCDWLTLIFYPKLNQFMRKSKAGIGARAWRENEHKTAWRRLQDTAGDRPEKTPERDTSPVWKYFTLDDKTAQ